MKFLEEFSMNALPALQTVLDDGWILRFAEGYTNRANSVNPIYPGVVDLESKIERCEAVYRGKNIRPTYKITPFIFPENLDAVLEQRGYQKIHPTSVQTLELNNLTKPTIQSIETNYVLTDQWFEHYCKLHELSGESKTVYRKMLANSVPLNFYILLYVGEKVVACGRAILEAGFIGLCDITVAKECRNQGYGQQLLLNMLEIGKKIVAKNAYLQVMTANSSAVHLYNKIGFREVYQYHYRTLID